MDTGQKTPNDDNPFVFVVAQGAGRKKDRCHLCKESGDTEKQKSILWSTILMYERIMNITASLHQRCLCSQYMILLKERHIEPKSELEPKFEPQPSARLSSQFEKKSFFFKAATKPEFSISKQRVKKSEKDQKLQKGCFRISPLESQS